MDRGTDTANTNKGEMYMLPMITPKNAAQMLRDGKARLVDIREPDEWSMCRIPQAEAAPLSVLPWLPLAPAGDGKAIIFTCNSSRRTTANSDLLEGKAQGSAWQLEGGIQNWIQQGMPVEMGKRTISIARQVQIVAGFLVLVGLVGSLVLPALVWVSAFVGMGLVFSGVTGTCAMGSLLSFLPWNRD